MRPTTAQGRAVRDQLGSRAKASGLVCPACDGGQSRERSLIVWRDGTQVVSKCKRAKCCWYGRWDQTDLGLLPVAPQKPKRFLVDTHALTEASQAALAARYGLRRETLAYYGLRQDMAGTAAYCPVWGPTGVSRGWVRRNLDGRRPKVQSFPGHDHPELAAWLAWFPCGSDTVVMVEDVFSAMRLWERGITGVALLGVAITDLRIAEVRRFGKDIVAALDEDAFTLSIRAAIKYEIKVRFVRPDIKDMTEEQLTQWITALHSSPPALAPAPPAELFPRLR